LHFPSQTEEAFEQERSQDRIAHFRHSVVGAIFLFNSFLLLDYFCIPWRFGLCVAVRLGIATPLALLCYAAVSRVGRRIREMIFAFTPLPSMGCVLILYDRPLGYAAASQMALILMMMYSINAMRPGFAYTCFSTFALGVGDSVFLATNPALDKPLAITFASLIWTAALLALASSYWQESQERRSYLLRIQVQAQNTDLMRISTMDALTGIANRRYLDNRLRTMWQESIAFGSPISALMIDLDHFKKINDSYGHEYGDTVLCLVARALHHTLRGEQDVVARYGGEEFVAILPNRPIESARSIAERLRMAVGELTLPPGNTELHPHITISVGVASLTPAAGSNQTKLLRDADEALYKAKDHGRDRVWP